MNKLTKIIEPFIDAIYPILYINSYEDLKVNRTIQDLSENYNIKTWSITNSDNESLVDFLSAFINGFDELNNSIIVLEDIHNYLIPTHNEYDRVVALLKKIVFKILNDDEITANIIITSPVIKIPIELEKFIAIFEVPLPDFDEIKKIVQNFANDFEEDISQNSLEKMSNFLKGLTETEINILLNMIYADGSFGSKEAEKLIIQEKKQIIKKGQILEMVETSESLETIGGLENLKNWLTKKSKVFSNIKKAKKFGVDTPKGVFIVGMPGCGKSLTAKATSILFDNIPLLRLDIGRLMGKYVGESEANMRKAISQAEAISPSILWIDEIEKAFTGIGQGGNGSEVATRLFGYFLTWMQEKKSEVYVVATANDISNLPPELLRKGRFDEVFFVDFPNAKEREQIFKVHIKNRGHQSDEIDIKKLASKTDGYSGADIETIVKETIENAFIEDKTDISTNDYLEVIKDITSISEMLKKQIEYYEKIKKELKMKKASR